MKTCFQPHPHRNLFIRLVLILALWIALPGSASPAQAMASTFTVTSAAASGPGSLANAISGAASGDTIVFDSTLSGQTIALSSTLILENKILTIDGSGLATPVTISGENLVQVMQVSSGTVILKGLIITKGKAVNGGGILNYAVLQMIGCTISGNSATSSGGGIYNIGTLSVDTTTITGNTTDSLGGGIYNNGALAVVQNSTLSSNNAASSGGGIYNNNGKELNIAASTISNNSASFGGGIDNSGTLIMRMVTFSGNSASTNGGGIENNGQLTVTNSTFSGNTANLGGGISNNSDLTIRFSTFSDNTVSVGGGAIYHAAGTLKFSNSILANSIYGPSATERYDCYVPGTATIGTNSNNLVESSNCGTASITADPLLGPLADNDGYTQTHALLPGSPALDVVECTSGSDDCPSYDQRMVKRPQGVRRDLGAFEQQTPGAYTEAAYDITGTGATLYSWVNARGFPTTVTFEYGKTTDYGSSAAATPGTLTGQSSTTVTAPLSGLQPGQTYHFRVVATNSIGTAYGADVTFTTLETSTLYLPLLVR